MRHMSLLDKHYTRFQQQTVNDIYIRYINHICKSELISSIYVF